MPTIHGRCWDVEWKVPGEDKKRIKSFSSRADAERFMSTDAQRFYSQQLFQSRLIRESYLIYEQKKRSRNPA